MFAIDRICCVDGSNVVQRLWKTFPYFLCVFYDTALWTNYFIGAINRFASCYNKCLKCFFGYPNVVRAGNARTSFTSISCVYVVQQVVVENAVRKSTAKIDNDLYNKQRVLQLVIQHANSKRSHEVPAATGKLDNSFKARCSTVIKTVSMMYMFHRVVHHFAGFTSPWSSPLRRLRGSVAGGARPETLRTVCEINQTTIFMPKLALLMHIIMQM